MEQQGYTDGQMMRGKGDDQYGGEGDDQHSGEGEQKCVGVRSR